MDLSKISIDFNAIIAFFALIFSIVAFCKSHRAQRVSNHLQKIWINIEKQREHDRSKALLFPQAIKKRSGLVEVTVANTGASAARNLRVMLDNQPIQQHPRNAFKQEIPSLLQPRQDAKVGYLSGNDRDAQTLNLKIIWDDDSGTGQIYEEPVHIR